MSDEEVLARHLIGAARASMDEILVKGNRRAVRIRMHPLDAETIVAGLFGGEQVEAVIAHGAGFEVLGLPVEQDEDVQLGMPVAEFEA